MWPACRLQNLQNLGLGDSAISLPLHLPISPADDLEDKCQKLVCECDQEAAKCLAKAPYHVGYLFWPESLCGEQNPKCKDD